MSQIEQIGSVQAATCTEPEVNRPVAFEYVKVDFVAHDQTDVVCYIIYYLVTYTLLYVTGVTVPNRPHPDEIKDTK